jgi:hypothetical protein
MQSANLKYGKIALYIYIYMKNRIYIYIHIYTPLPNILDYLLFFYLGNILHFKVQCISFCKPQSIIIMQNYVTVQIIIQWML